MPEDGRQERQREDDRAEDDERAGDADRADGRGREQEQPGQPDGDRDAAERDGLAGGRDGPLDGLADGPAAAQLLAEAADDEQRVVDRQGEAEHRRDVEHEDAHLDLLGDEVDEGEAAGDREAGDEERHPGRDDRGEDEDEDERDDRQRDELGLLEVLLGLLGGVLGDRPIAGQLVGVAGRRHDRRADVVDDVDRLLVGQVELDDDVGGVAGGADEARVAGLGVADDARSRAGCRERRRSRSRWRPGTRRDVASAPGVADRKRAMTELLPAPNSVSSRAATAADSELASSQPPAERADEVWVARIAPAMATMTATRTMGRRKR